MIRIIEIIGSENMSFINWEFYEGVLKVHVRSCLCFALVSGARGSLGATKCSMNTWGPRALSLQAMQLAARELKGADWVATKKNSFFL